MRASTEGGSLVVTAETAPWGTVIAAEGELDITAVPELRDHLDGAVGAGVRRLLLDLTDVTFIDSVSLAAVVAAHRRMGPGGRVVVATGHPYVLLILEAGGVDSVLDVVATRAEAEAALSR